MIIWGGTGRSDVLNTGGKYDPSTDIWKPVTMEDAPTPRVFHTAIWDGLQMIIWGGVGNGGVGLNTGGRYNPSTDTWTSITTEGAPESRNGHTAIWDGHQMIIWGGSNNEGVSNTGSKFSK